MLPASVPWKSVDLNLLVAFAALYECRSVTLAAEKTFVSQSAMSHSLGRLRQLFDDPLFERQGNVMEPSERAHELAKMAQSVLDQVSNELSAGREFDPQRYTGVCRIGLSDYAEFIFAPEIFDRISSEAPGCQVSFINVNRSNYLQRAEKEKLDLIIGSFDQLDPRFELELLYTERHVCLYDPQKVSLSSPVTLEEYTRYPHALVSADGSLVSGVDGLLSALGAERQVRVAAGHFFTVRRLLSSRSMLAVVPARMARLDFADGLSHTRPPVPVPDFEISLVWRKQNSRNDKHKWLKKLVFSVCSTPKE